MSSIRRPKLIQNDTFLSGGVESPGIPASEVLTLTGAAITKNVGDADFAPTFTVIDANGVTRTGMKLRSTDRKVIRVNADGTLRVMGGGSCTLELDSGAGSGTIAATVAGISYTGEDPDTGVYRYGAGQSFNLTTVAGYVAYIESLKGADGADQLKVFQRNVNQDQAANKTTAWRDHNNAASGKWIPTTEAPTGAATENDGHITGQEGLEWDDTAYWRDEVNGRFWGTWLTTDTASGTPLIIGSLTGETGGADYTGLTYSYAAGKSQVYDYAGKNAVFQAGAGPVATDSMAGGKTVFGMLAIHPNRYAITHKTGRMIVFSSRADTQAARTSTQTALGTGTRRIRICKGNPLLRAWGFNSGATDWLEGVITGRGVPNPAQSAAIADMGEAFFNQYVDRRDFAGIRGNSFVARVGTDAGTNLAAGQFTSPRGVCVSVIGWDGATAVGLAGNRDYTDPTKDWGVAGTTRYLERFIDLTKCTKAAYGGFELINGGGNIADEMEMHAQLKAAIGVLPRYHYCTRPIPGGTPSSGGALNIINTNLRTAAAVPGHTQVDWESNVVSDAAHNVTKFWQAAHPTDSSNVASGTPAGGSAADCGGQLMANAVANSIVAVYNPYLN
jgi:hypothetical protein